MKEEVPPALIDAHVRSVEAAINSGKEVTATFGLDKSGIAGTSSDKEEGSKMSRSTDLECQPGIAQQLSLCNECKLTHQK